MKISPVKNYKKPAYALKLAALLTAAASVSGCAENAGAAMTTEEPAATGTAETREGNAPAYQQTTAAPETTISGTVTTVETTKECIDNTELAGAAAMPEETAPKETEEVTEETAAETTTAAVTTTAALTTVAAAVTATTTTTTTEECVVDGMMEVPEDDYTETELDGEYEETELDGDVAVPEEDPESQMKNYYMICDCARDVVAEVYFPRELTVEFETNDGIFESDIHAEFVNTYEEDYSNNAYIVFVDKNDANAMALYGDIKNAKKVSFGYLAEGNMYGNSAKFAIVLINGLTSTISEDTARFVVNTMLAEGWIQEYEPIELEGDVEMPEEEVDTTTHDYAKRSLDELKKAFKDVHLTAVIPDEKVSDSVWVRGKGYSVVANLDVGLNSSFVSYTPIYLSFFDTNDKKTLNVLKKMGIFEYKYGYFTDVEYWGKPIRVIFVEVSGFNGKLGANAAKKLVAEMNTTGALEFEIYDETELAGEPVIDEEN